MSAHVTDGSQESLGVLRQRRVVVTARDIQRFAQATGCAVETLPDGTLLAPPLFFQSMAFEEVPHEKLPADGSPTELDVPLPARRTVGGGSEYTLYRRVREGETVTVASKLRAVERKQARSGELFVVQVETSFASDAGEPLAREVASFIKKV
ncbi:MAG: MaoC family dehydratase N-terminal domain-containing protein [Myxococcaceae bacterium]